jgi:hypothetical protein
MAHPFHWVPAANARHATQDPRPPDGFPDGTPVHTLCGQTVPACTDAYARFWDTCLDCYAAAHRLLDDLERR